MNRFTNISNTELSQLIYQERTAQQAPQQPTVAVTDTSGYITREEFEARIAEITATTERTDINAE